MDKSKRIIIIDYCNYEDYPIGGYLTFEQNMMISFGDSLALVGITTDREDPIGSWFKKSINGIVYDFFAYAFYSKSITKHLIPDRLASYYYTKYYRKQILELPVSNIFIQRPEILIGIKDYGYNSVCYCFAGLENPLSISKYWYAKFIAETFEKVFFRHLKNADQILASGDETAIQGMITRSKGIINRKEVVQFPSRINTAVYKPIDKDVARRTLNLTPATSIVVTSGRLGWLKGWKFMIDCFYKYENLKPGSVFYFIGEGEDKENIIEYIKKLGLEGKVILAGKQNQYGVANYLNAADLFIMGSYKEGWSTALIEAIACGTPACVTNFSAAKEIVRDGINGCVIDEHDIDQFTKGMISASGMLKPVNNENVLAYSVDKLKADMLLNWELKD
jgi:glycosyltransferase involved in cell wall biosynthesis